MHSFYRTHHKPDSRKDKSAVSLSLAERVFAKRQYPESIQIFSQILIQAQPKTSDGSNVTKSMRRNQRFILLVPFIKLMLLFYANP